MRLSYLLSAVLGVVIAIAGGRALAAAEPDSLETLVEQYLPVRAALAADDLDTMKEHAAALAEANDRTLAAAARALVAAEDMAAGRKAFGNVSRALIAQVASNEKKKKDRIELPTLHVFACSMSKPYGKWLQVESEISNPYTGSKMPRCGKRVDLLGGGGEPARLIADYVAIRAALASDSLEGVKAHAEVLTVAKDKSISGAAGDLASAKSIAAARRSFGEVSRALIEQVESIEKKNRKKKKGGIALPPLHLFECPMASPYGKWLQTEPDISNPYMGSRMPRCGKLVSSFGGNDGDAVGYVCPMHPDVTASKPGKCSKCGMALRKKE